jgi:hypothetical protein
LPISLAGIARTDGDRIARGLELPGELGTEALRHRRGAFGDRQITGKLADPRPVVAQRGERVLLERRPRDRRGDEGIAVAVAADP